VNTAPTWLQKALAGRKIWRSGIFRAILPEDMPPLTIDGYTLETREVNAVLSLIKDRDADFFAKLKQYTDPQQLHDFAERIFKGWLADGAKTDHRWALFAYAQLGGDKAIDQIIEFIRQNQQAKKTLHVKLGFEALALNGAPPALFYLYSLWLGSKTNDYRKAALKPIEIAAKERGLSVLELGDQVIPEWQYDGYVFDYGPRKFTLSVTPELELVLRDANGKVRAEMPKIGKRDVPELAAAAQAEWEKCQRFLNDTKLIQSTLLEKAMVDERRWSLENFNRVFLRHTLMRNFAQRLIWGVYENGLLGQTFLVGADATLSDADYRALLISDNAQVGLLHPVHLSPEGRSLWNGVLHDYEIIQPFPQLGRDVYTLTEAEQQAAAELHTKQITRFEGIEIKEKNLYGGKNSLTRKGWQFSEVDRVDRCQAYARKFLQAEVTAVLVVKFMMGVSYTSNYTFQSCYFRTEKDILPLMQISPVIISEVLRDLTRITTK
jgi:hypothetical protein